MQKEYKYVDSRSLGISGSLDVVLEDARKNNIDIFESLLTRKILKEEEVAQLKAEYLKVPYVNLTEWEPDKEALKIIPQQAAGFYHFVAFGLEGKTLKVAMLEPSNLDALDALKFIAIKHNVEPRIHLISRSSFNWVMKQYESFGEELKSALATVDDRMSSRREADETVTVSAVAEEAPVSKVVGIIIAHAVEGRASDIHIELTEKDLKVRYRLDGELHESLVLPKKLGPAVVSRVKILSGLKIDETRKPQDGRFRFYLSNQGGIGKAVDLRVSTFPTVNGEKVVMRILDTSSDVGNLESLGVWGKQLRLVNQNIEKPFGIILVTGPTGSGKSTTLYAVLKMLNKEGVNIVTLEDPVEYYLEGVNQSQVKPEIGYTFASGLRSILRQDPDIVMVGEIRDKETAELAVHAALTGHLVLSTLHTNNSIGIIPRLVDMGIEPFLIGSALNIGIAQRLVRKICPYCKEEITLPPEIMEKVREELEEIATEAKKGLDLSNGLKFHKGKGCKECKNSGSIGRIAIYEVLSMTPDMEKLITKTVTDHDIELEAKRQGMVTMKQDGIIKALKGITTIEEVLRATEE